MHGSDNSTSHMGCGLRQSRIVTENAPPDVLHTGMQSGSSFLMAIMAKLALGASTLEGHQMILHPLAFAGWLGLLVTALNLLPIGQLDGRHVAHAMFGVRRWHAISVGGLMTLFALALFVWPGLMMCALVVWFIAGESRCAAVERRDAAYGTARAGMAGVRHPCRDPHPGAACALPDLRNPLSVSVMLNSAYRRDGSLRHALMPVLTLVAAACYPAIKDGLVYAPPISVRPRT